jgi:excisionase family DNA binding protein
MEHKELLTIEEVAELTGFSVGTLYHWVSQGRIPVVRLSARCIRFRRSDIDEWLEQHFVPASGGAER